MKCVQCGFRGDMPVERIDMKHDILPRVTLRGVGHYTCPECGEEYFSFERIAQLRTAIRDVVVAKPGPLAPEEFLYLRKYLGWSSQDTAARMGVDPATVSRWENGRRAIGAMSDRLIRALAMLDEPTQDYGPEFFEFGREPSDREMVVELKDRRWAVAC